MTEQKKPRQLLRVDTHGHSEYSFDAYTPPEKILEKAREREVVPTISDHDTFEGIFILQELIEEREHLEQVLLEGYADTSRLIEELQGICVPGIEVTCRTLGGVIRHPHLLILGVDPHCVTEEEIPKNRLVVDVIDWARSMKGRRSQRGKAMNPAIIIPHPSRENGMFSLSYNDVRALAPYVDGIEVAGRFADSGDPTIRQMARHYNLAQLGSSDFHLPQDIGRIVTGIPIDDEPTVDAIIQAVHNRSTFPMSLRMGPYDDSEKKQHYITRAFHRAVQMTAQRVVAIPMI